MENVTFGGVNIFDPLHSRMGEIIEQFVLYYGENYRQKIERALGDNTTFIFVPQSGADFYMAELDFSMQNYIHDTTCAYYNHFKTDLNVNLFDMFGMPFDYGSIVSAEQKWLSGKPLNGNDKKIIESFIEGAGGESSTKAGVVNLINKFKEQYKLNVLPHLEQLELERKNVLSIMTKNYNAIETEKDNYYNDLMDLIENYFYFVVAHSGTNFSNNDIKRLMPIYKELITIGKLPKFVTSKQAVDYIKLLNSLNINYGDCYLDYYKNKEAFEHILFKPALMHQIKVLDKELENNLKEKNIFFTNAVKIIESLNMKYPQHKKDAIDNLYNFIYFDDCAGFVLSYIEGGTNEYKLVCICGDYITLGTDTLIHEMNHIVDMNLLFENDMYICEKSGLDIVPIGNYSDYLGEISDKFCDEDGNRHYMYLSEALNEFFALEITNQLTENGQELCIGQKRGSAYRFLFPILGKFMEDNKELLKKAKMENSIEAVYKIIPKTDLNTLAKISTKVITSKGFIGKVAEEIKTKANVDIYNYDKTFELLVTKDGDNWSSDAKKFFSYLETVNTIGQKIKTANETTPNP